MLGGTSSPPRTMTKPWPKAVLFDLDDTLWPIAPVIIEAEKILYAWLAEHAPRVAQQYTIETLRQARLELLASRPEFQLDLGALRRAGLRAVWMNRVGKRNEIPHLVEPDAEVTSLDDLIDWLRREHD